MALYDLYEAYRNPALDAGEQSLLDQAGQDREQRTLAQIRIVCRRAQAQFSSWEVLPEDPNLSLRFPGVDPVGKYSLIDMKLARRQILLSARLQACPPEVHAFFSEVRRSAGPTLEKLREAMTTDASNHRILTRASKLCLDEDGRRQLHLRARALESAPAAAACDLYLQGLEYAAGLREGPVLPEVEAFYEKTLGVPIPQSVLEAGQAFRAPDHLSVRFPDFGHRLLQLRFSDPRNWGKTQEELAAAPMDTEAVAAALPAYAAAAASPVLDAAFFRSSASGLSRADLLRLDGSTIRERLARDTVSDPTTRQLQDQPDVFVAAALMAGRKVEALLPDAGGTAHPIPVVGTGYAPTSQDRLSRTVWEQFSAKHGFYPPEKAPVRPIPRQPHR